MFMSRKGRKRQITQRLSEEKLEVYVTPLTVIKQTIQVCLAK